MDRYRSYKDLDDFPEVYGDVQFSRLDMLADPATLPAGSLQASVNFRFDTNGLKVRGGLSRKLPAGNSVGAMVWCGIYSPNGQADLFVLIAARTLWTLEPLTQTLTAYGLPAGEEFLAGDEVCLVQATIGSGTLPNLYITHGLENNVLVFDGTAVTVDSTFPKALFAMAYQNRGVAATTLQELQTSDYLDFTTWNVLNQFQIETGGADYLVTTCVYQNDYVLIGTRRKWFIAYFDPNLGTASAYTGSLNSDTSFLRVLTEEAGPVGREAVCYANGLIWFVGDFGIFAFAPQLDNTLTVLGRPLSAAIQPIFSRMNAAAASGACVAHYGYRIYFALPISDVPVAITNIVVTGGTVTDLRLPVKLPCRLGNGALATITTATPHGCGAADTVQIDGVSGAGLNGQYRLVAVIDANNLIVALPTTVTVILGAKATLQRLAVRNNMICVLNLNNASSADPQGAWESIDTLPTGLFADWLRVAYYGSQRRLWVVDANSGPALYEEGDADETGDLLGGVRLPCRLPVILSAANFSSVPIAGRARSRTFQWQPNLGMAHGSIAYVRRVRASEARLTLETGDAGTLTTYIRKPARAGQAQPDNVVSQSFAADPVNEDTSAFSRLGIRGLEAELEVVSTSGRPLIRALEVQTMQSGRY